MPSQSGQYHVMSGDVSREHRTKTEENLVKDGGMPICGCCGIKLSVYAALITFNCKCQSVERKCYKCARKICHCRCP